MEIFITRAAQSAFNQAGYSKEDAYHQALVVAHQMVANIEQYQIRYGISDELELAYEFSRDVVAYRAPIRRRLIALCQ